MKKEREKENEYAVFASSLVLFIEKDLPGRSLFVSANLKVIEGRNVQESVLFANNQNYPSFILFKLTCVGHWLLVCVVVLQ